MHNKARFFIYIIFTVLFFISCFSQKKAVQTTPAIYVPENPELYRIIVQQDSLFFDAYNNCKMAVMDTMISTDLEFYHDKGGLSTSKAEILQSLQDNICNKVTRELIKGSIEVYPIAGYGAIEMGQHRFNNKQENPNEPSRPGKFVQTWQNKNGQWKLTRIISLH